MSDYRQKTSQFAILHKQICDNFSRCPAMIKCQEYNRKIGREPAVYLNDGKIDINRDNCTGCALCLDKCGLFRIVHGAYDELKYKEEFDNDPRNNMNFSVERFGCDIIDKRTYLLSNLSEVSKYIQHSDSNKVNILEFVDESLVMCPFQAVEVDYIRKQFEEIGGYKKFVIASSDLTTLNEIERQYKINQFPAILLLYRGAILGEPIFMEFRVVKEEQRMNVQHELEATFAERLKIIFSKK